MLDFEIGVYAANEASTLEACVTSIDQACASCDAGITVILNGTRDNSLDVLASLRLQHASLRVCRLSLGDKSNAINTFFYDLRRPAAVYVQVDGYARISPGSLIAMRKALSRSDKINIVSACQTTGRSAEAESRRTLAGGKCTGQFHALRASFLDRLVAANLRFPLQLYRGDGLLGSMAAHDLDPITQPWDNDRIVGIPDAQFEITPLSIWRWQDIKRQYRRQIRQIRGRIENEAIKSIIYVGGYQALPHDANDMIEHWIELNTTKSRHASYYLRALLALGQLNSSSLSPNQPEIMFERLPVERG